MAESWMQLVQRVYRDNKSKNSSYKFKQAMVDAKKMYKAPGAPTPSFMDMGSKKSRKHGRKSKKHHKHGKKTRKHHKKH
jgi:hypothetical protein